MTASGRRLTVISHTIIILDKICFDVNQTAWEAFVDQMDRLQDKITDIRNNEGRIYRDIHGSRYYWVSPVELWPWR